MPREVAAVGARRGVQTLAGGRLGLFVLPAASNPPPLAPDHRHLLRLAVAARHEHLQRRPDLSQLGQGLAAAHSRRAEVRDEYGVAAAPALELLRVRACGRTGGRIDRSAAGGV